MSKISDLIAKLCPNGVEYKKLGDVLLSVHTGLNPRQNFRLNTDGATNYYVTVKEISSGKLLFSDKTDRIDDKALGIIQNRSCLETGDVLLSGIGTIGRVAVVEIPTNNFNCSESVYLLKPNTDKIISKYLGYILETRGVQKQWEKSSVGSTLKGIRKETLVNVLIPVPPVKIQREIVEVLDKFALLTAELTAELEKRKKQYEHYRRALLGEVESEELKVESGKKWPMVKLGDVCNFVYGYTDKAKDSGNARFIRITDINDGGHLNHDGAKYIILNQEAVKYLLNKGDLVMARTGATYGKTLYFDSDEAAVYASFLIRIVPDNVRLNNRYYWHFSQCGLYWEQAKRLVTTGGQPQFNTGAISQVSIPLPPLAEQERIVKILDKFDKLCNDLTSGLPAEIAARKKQYEYYRDKLLNFKRAA